jgi:hypothetical protein
MLIRAAELAFGPDPLEELAREARLPTELVREVLDAPAAPRPRLRRADVLKD